MDLNVYVHPDDRIALKALEAIPGFHQVLKFFMKIWDEKVFRVENMATNLRINENQLPKYYRMLPPICEKLGIEIPELYLSDDVEANAYTYGDTKPFIVITKGLLETLPDELIPTVLAHECGHIACHHVLYKTMAYILCDKLISAMKEYLPLQFGIQLTRAAIDTILMGLRHWERSAELSADRAAALCDGTTENIVQMCMYFSGYDKDFAAEANVDEFISQAFDYKEMVKNGKINALANFLLYSFNTHPVNAVRALDCYEWGKTTTFQRIVSYMNEPHSEELSLSAYIGEISMPEASKYYIGKNVSEVFAAMQALGFTNVQKKKITYKRGTVKVGQVLCVRVNGQDTFELCERVPTDSDIQIEYYESETQEEIAAAHPNQLRVPNSYKYYLGKQSAVVIVELQQAGFQNIQQELQQKTKKGLRSKGGAIVEISINGQTQFAKQEWFDKDALIKIVYYTYEQ